MRGKMMEEKVISQSKRKFYGEFESEVKFEISHMWNELMVSKKRKKHEKNGIFCKVDC